MSGPISFTGSCPVRQHTADGHYVGRCDHSTYDERCRLHGHVGQWLGPDADDRNLPPRDQLDFGPKKLRRYLGIERGGR